MDKTNPIIAETRSILKLLPLSIFCLRVTTTNENRISRNGKTVVNTHFKASGWLLGPRYTETLSIEIVAPIGIEVIPIE